MAAVFIFQARQIGALILFSVNCYGSGVMQQKVGLGLNLTPPLGSMCVKVYYMMCFITS